MLPPASPAVKRRTEPRDVENYRTCCDCCHIKVGTVFLGLLEAMISLGLLFTLTQKIVWKTRQSALCNKSLLADCIFYQFVHYNVTLIYDYIIVILLSLVLFSILLMFCGIMSETSSMLLPHLFIQAAFLLFSIGYFLLYAWTYFYGDLYTHNRKFTVQVLMERMWFSTLLMLIAACQVYLFFAVAKCTIYLAKMEECRRQRESAFWRTSERVRIAKENGLWRNNGVGGFMQYTTQYDPEANTKKKTPKEGRVQWNMEPTVVVLTEEEEEEKSRAEAARLAKAASSSCAPSTSTQAERQGTAEAASHKHHHHHHHSQSTKRSSKESVQRSSSGGSGSGGSPTRKPHEHHRREEAEDGAKQKRHSHSKRTVAHTDSNEKKERTATSKDRGGNSKPSPEKIKGHRGSIGSSSGMRRSSSGGTTGGTPVETTSQKASSRRSSRPLRKLKSVDSADQLALSEEVQETRTRSRRRSSDAGVASSIQNPCKADLNNSPRRHHRREESNRSAATSTPNSSSADRRPHDSSIFKKVSITTTITPLA